MDTTPLAAFRETHRAWLRELGILDRPWLVFGSAPEPTLPDGLLRSHVRVDVNNAGRAAADRGLGPADLTIRAQMRSWKEHPDVTTRGLLWFYTAPTFVVRLRLLRKRRAKVGSLMTATQRDREALVDLVCGASVAPVGERGKASNGVAAACYALFVGAPEVVMAGISLSRHGHSHDDWQRQRLQIPEDTFVLGRIREDPRLFTTETGLAAESGLRLWRAGHEA